MKIRSAPEKLFSAKEFIIVAQSSRSLPPKNLKNSRIGVALTAKYSLNPGFRQRLYGVCGRFANSFSS